ncbi:unnamed protein product [Caretta caretta]
MPPTELLYPLGRSTGWAEGEGTSTGAPHFPMCTHTRMHTHKQKSQSNMLMAQLLWEPLVPESSQALLSTWASKSVHHKPTKASSDLPMNSPSHSTQPCWLVMAMSSLALLLRLSHPSTE